ncbi:hypothetical protein BCR32DRAFT_239500 [Anaeromyces robustus]|uniref:L domain-like protein n=1 Tax=Anaeromyces robustus TaxID=1754192 RepID=A0A1Y1XR26_9FUNG|nr:hypothetical protein BCR32DRAFT_239500 [Anaeromyces robustus]|eukprot:ORX88229.1 hypothetical protein BCR32DRAFT_239500 [Anaeromyces robustus]
MNLKIYLSKLINNLKNFEYLLRINKFNILELIPNSIGKLQKLNSLSLFYNEVFSVLPDSFGNLKRVEDLDLYYCKELKILPSTIGNFKKHKKISLYETNISSLPNTFGNLKNTMKFLDNNLIDDEITESYNDLP